MEESSEVHSEENKICEEKNKKRRLKTPSQVQALEKFYNEHKYPTESMKSELAEEIGLTEKQISGWFCHRRLKDKKLLEDEAGANGRQDRSSGVIQDRGSGYRQDSCGSTKHGDYRHIDPREVESRRFYGQEFSAADLNYEHRSHYTGNFSGMGDTSSESSSDLQDRFFPQNEDPFDVETSRLPTRSGIVMPINAKGAQNRGFVRPSGYLKVKGEIENVAITAVKRQLGRHYREDGPPLGVEFQPLPPGAFESSIRDQDDEPYYVGNSIMSQSPDNPGVRKPPSLSTRYEVCSSKLASQNSCMEEANFGTMHGFDSRDNYSNRQLKQKGSFPNYSNSSPGWNFSKDMHEDATGETSFVNSNKNYEMRSNPGIEGIRLSSVSNRRLHPYGGKVTSEQTDSWLHEYDDIRPKIVQQKEYLKSKPSNLILQQSGSCDDEGRGQLRNMAKMEEVCRERRAMREYSDPVGEKVQPTNEMRVAKRVRDESPPLDYAKKSSFAETPTWGNQIKGSAMEMPSSFSEDETAETSSSVD